MAATTITSASTLADVSRANPVKESAIDLSKWSTITMPAMQTATHDSDYVNLVYLGVFGFDLENWF
jgi:hypothetical protein